MIRGMEDGDFQDLAEMLQDPDVVRAYDHEFTDDDVQAWLDRQKQRMSRFGFSLCALISKKDGVMIGQAGLTWQKCEDSDVLEIGYMLKKKFWHQGYARGVASACHDYAFSVLKAERVHSVIKTGNEALKRVAEAIGMRPEKEF